MKLPDAVKQRALDIYQREGMTAAADAVGVHTTTVCRWARDAGVRYAVRGDAELGLTGREAAEEVGVSYRQVDNWQSTGVVQPSYQPPGTGHYRRYLPDDVEALGVVACLVDAGLRLDRLREMSRDERSRLLKVLQGEGFA